MKILYDISVLGLGHVHNRAKTGVFRVVENVANQLVNDSHCLVTFCSNLDLNNLEDCRNYLQKQNQFKNTAFAIPSDFNKRFQIANEKFKISHKLNNNNLSFIEKTSDKILFRKLMLEEKIFYSKNLIDLKELNKTDIFHSPFFAIKDSIKKSGVHKIFITIYDLIPILYPKFFEQGVIDAIQEMLNSITTETWILCISNSTKHDLLNYMGNKVNKDRVLVTDLAASDLFYPSTNKFHNEFIRKKYNIRNTPYILSLCTLEPRKNINKAIRAFANMITQEKISDLNLVLVGPKGWDYEQIFDEIKILKNIKDRIIITGFVADEDLAAIYSDALLFIYPSYYEGFGLPPLEAMQCGVPVVTSNTSSLPEVVGDAGIMVGPDDIDALSDSMLSIYKNETLQKSMAEASLIQAQKFSWERCGNETIAAYKLSMK